MSTHWGYVCQSHDPELESDDWFNHGEARLIELLRIERAGHWLNDEWGNPTSVPELEHAGPIYWLREHPRCKVALRNEYGATKEIPGQPAMPLHPSLLNGWRLIAPIEAVPGDGLLLPSGEIHVLDEHLMFEAIPLEVRRVTWAVRRIE